MPPASKGILERAVTGIRRPGREREFDFEASGPLTPTRLERRLRLLILGRGRGRGYKRRIRRNPASRPYTPQDLLAAVYRHLGISPTHELADAAGRPLPVLAEGRPIPELV